MAVISDNLPWHLPILSVLISSQQWTVGKYICSKFQANHYTKHLHKTHYTSITIVCVLSYMSHLHKQQEGSVGTLACTQDTANQKCHYYPHSSFISNLDLHSAKFGQHPCPLVPGKLISTWWKENGHFCSEKVTKNVPSSWKPFKITTIKHQTNVTTLVPWHAHGNFVNISYFQTKNSLEKHQIFHTSRSYNREVQTHHIHYIGNKNMLTIQKAHYIHTYTLQPSERLLEQSMIILYHHIFLKSCHRTHPCPATFQVGHLAKERRESHRHCAWHCHNPSSCVYSFLSLDLSHLHTCIVPAQCTMTLKVDIWETRVSRWSKPQEEEYLYEMIKKNLNTIPCAVN
jgi:hypothetical protein